MVISKEFKTTLREVENEWSMSDLYKAHAVLDMLEAAQKKARIQSKTKGK